MNRIPIAAAAALLLAAPAVGAAPAEKPASKSGGSATQIARGRYLVEKVAMCADCHSPRDEKGQFIRDRWLLGSVVTFKSTVPVPRWAEVAPPIAGLPGLTPEQGITFLMTGKEPSGETPDPPMPEYRMNREDAAAVVAYLRSLAPTGSR
jgi:mono/diheme cytochrome c family protein